MFIFVREKKGRERLEGKGGTRKVDKPVSIAVDSKNEYVYVVTEAGHVYVTRSEVGAWRDLGPVPGTAAAKKRK